MHAPLDLFGGNERRERRRVARKIVSGLGRMPDAMPRLAAQAVHCDIRTTQARQRHQLVQDLSNLLVGFLWRKPVTLNRATKPCYVIVKPEKDSIPYTDDVINYVRPTVSPVCHRDSRLRNWHEFAIEISRTCRPLINLPLCGRIAVVDTDHNWHPLLFYSLRRP
ncbi:hypothetical protein AOX55_00006718 (plasmid) [Sinorhizobium fredii CCBAU 25509]|nr:hypothetical protein AOX55_00006718 [Sinorhizobium fredii CCBAU 25509]